MTTTSNPANPANDAKATAKPKTRDRTIDIDGMKGDECVGKVSKAINEVKGVSLDSVKVGQAKLRSATKDEAGAVCASIKNNTGFEARLAPKADAHKADATAGAQKSSAPKEHAPKL